MSTRRWQVEQVLALAPKPSSVAAAQPLAVPARWAGTGCDSCAVWGRCVGSSAEPYECAVDHVEVAFRCTCPSRVVPCKHSLALLLLWARGQVAEGEPPPFAATWIARRLVTAEASAATEPSNSPPVDSAGETVDSAPAAALPPPDPGKSRDDRIARMAAGLAELDRWLDDRLRTGLSDPSLASYKTWDGLAARLVDAQVGGLANRVRRLAGLVGAHPDWHAQVLSELGLLHLLATSGRHLGTLPPGLADSVATTIGWQVRQAEVLAGVPHTDTWVVMGRSDTREDRIEVRRIWLRSTGDRTSGGPWAMVLSFAAYRQSLDASLRVGTQVQADVFRYPGAVALRVLMGAIHGDPQAAPTPVGSSVAEACTQVGRALAAEPWLERYPMCVVAAPTWAAGRWLLTDPTGSLPLVEGATGVATLLACSAGRPVTVTAEWTAGRARPAHRAPGRSRGRHRAGRRSIVRRGRHDHHVGTGGDDRRLLARDGDRGTARHRPVRESPAPPPGALGDLAADDPQPTPSQRLLQQVAACTVAQRAGMLPGVSLRVLAPPADDPRPVTPPAASATWRRFIDDWPLLEDEWMLAVIHSGHRLAPELVVPVLAHHRTDATRHARALVAAGTLGQWMIDWSPRLACTAKKPALMEAIGELPDLAILPELQTVLWASPPQAARTIAGGLSSGAFGISHRAVLVNVVARVQPASLPALAEAIGHIDASQPTIGLAFALADLARLRHQMLTELEPS